MSPAKRELRRLDLVTRALRLEYFCIAWSVLSATWSVVAGVLAGSLGVLALGLVVLADLSGSLAVVWRFRVERREQERAARAESHASLVVAGALMAVAAFLVVSAIVALSAGSAPSHSSLALAAAAAAAVVLTPLGVAKYRVGTALQSPSLKGDGTLSLVGAALGLLALGGLVAQRLWGWWWGDRVAALVAVVVMLAEAARVFRHRARYDGAGVR